MRKRSIVISTLCLLLALPSGALAEDNPAQTPQSVTVEKGRQVTEAVNSTLIATLADDFLGPNLESVTVSPTTVEVGNIVTITAKASDESGVAEATAYMNLPNGKGFKTIPLVLDTEKQEWKGTYTINDLDQEGTWIVDLILYDALGNYTWEVAPDTVQVVNNPNGDAELPMLGKVVVSPLNVRVDEAFTIRAQVNDNVKVASVYAYLYSVDGLGGSYRVPLTYEEAAKEWVVSHSFTKIDMPGNWYIDIEMEDTAGNFAYENLKEVLVLSNPNIDFTGPRIGEESFSLAIASPGDSIQVKVPVTDAQSGVRSVYAEFSHVDSPDDVKPLFLTPGPVPGEWVGDFNIESSFASGVWKVVFYATDHAGNSVFKENFSAFDVKNDNGDFDAPVFSDVQVTPQGDVQVGESVTVTAKISDNVGVDYVRAEIYSQEKTEYIELSYDATNDHWTGNLLVKGTTVPGFYQVSIAAWDASNNYDFAYAKGGFTVVNHDGDYTGPVISAVELDKTEVNAGEQQVTISATVEDAGSGVANVTAYYYENQSIALAYDSNLDKWIGKITIPLNVPDGEVIKIHFIEARDLAGNQSVQFLEGVSFLVRNLDGDFTAPVVGSFVMTPTTVVPGESVHFEAKLTDEKSGVKSATVFLYNDTDSIITTIDLTSSGANDIWTADYIIPATSGLGTYSVGLGFDDNAGNVVSATINQTLQIIEATVESAQYDVALWYYQNNNLYNAVYFAGAAISEGDRRPEVIEFMNDTAQALFDGAASMNAADAENAYHLLAATTGVPTAIKEAAQAKLTPEVNSPNYADALWYNDNGNFYNAVHYAGAAVAQGDTRPEVQGLLNSAAQALFDAAATMSATDAENAYNLLAATTGVPTAIKAAAEAKLAPVNSPNYDEAVFYYDNSNYYNAVHYASAAIAEGATQPKVQDFMNRAAQALLEAAPSMSAAQAQNAYLLLISTTGVPTAIKEAAQAKLTAEVSYLEGAWYFENGNHYNAVHFAGAAISNGNTRSEVQALMNSAAQALLDAAGAKSAVEAENDYNLLLTTKGVPTAIKEAAGAKLASEVSYLEGAWYFENGSNYNAVHYTGLAIAAGNTRPEVQALMNTAAQALLDAAATMNEEEALHAYTLLVNTTGVPANIKAAAQAKLSL